MTPTLALLAALSAAPGLLKGQLHLHTDNSGDSQTPAAVALGYYQRAGYDFVVVTDHDWITDAADVGSMLVFPGVELTQNHERCEPDVPGGYTCNLHVNALLVARPVPTIIPWPAEGSNERLGIFQRALDATRALGGIAQVNHPNWHRVADGKTLAELGRRGAVLVEVANQTTLVDDAGDARWPSMEAVWDAALSEGVLLYGTATDDAHHYDDAAAVRARGETAYPSDRGWVVVRAQRTAASIRDALARGDFYASNGVTLDDFGVRGGRLRVVVRDPPATVQFIGQGGKVLARRAIRAGPRSTQQTFALGRAPPGYLRAVVTDARGRKAWVQPVRTR